MRWSGLAIRDALTLERSAIRKEEKLVLVVTSRQKTGTDVVYLFARCCSGSLGSRQRG